MAVLHLLAPVLSKKSSKQQERQEPLLLRHIHLLTIVLLIYLLLYYSSHRTDDTRTHNSTQRRDARTVTPPSKLFSRRPVAMSPLTPSSTQKTACQNKLSGLRGSIGKTRRRNGHSFNIQTRIIALASIFMCSMIALINVHKGLMPSPNRLQDSKTKIQQVILLAGPHKTASSSIQLNMVNWLSNESHSFGLAKNWAWPSPIQKFRNMSCDNDNNDGSLIFYWWIQAMLGWKLGCYGGEVIYSREEMIELYRREFYDQLMKGYSLVIASEAMDFVGSQHDNSHEGLLEKIIHQLPWNANYSPAASGSDEDITAVVVYRSPRSDHLKSAWHECCMKNGQTFHEFIANPSNKFADAMKTIDSLYLAKRFLEKGLKVVLIDMAGVLEKGYDISNVVACDVLGADCNLDRLSNSAQGDKKTEMKNVKVNMETPHEVNVTTDELERINEEIKNYDCNYVKLLNHPNITILHSHSIEKLRRSCQDCNEGSCTVNQNQLGLKIAEILVKK